VGDVRRLIVFDLDGTLIDSRADLAETANALIAERGGSRLSEHDIGRMVGGGAALLVKRAFTAAGLPVDATSVPRFLELYDERLLATTRPYPGVLDALDSLTALAPIAVLTNKPLAPTRRLLDAFGLSRYVAVAIGGDGEFPRKPDPSSLLHLIDVFGVEPRRTVMVGDSLIDFTTARNAGTPICLARYGFGFETFPVAEIRGDEGLVDDPAQLGSVIRGLLDPV
jgi:phosphoglycolate phosphatase